MKQKIEVRVNDGDVRLSVVAYVTTDGMLTREEVQEIRERWAERLMQTIPGLPYTAIRLHRIRVR